MLELVLAVHSYHVIAYPDKGHNKMKYRIESELFTGDTSEQQSFTRND